MSAAPVPVPSGYAHPEYAGSFFEFGTPRQLPRCGGWILERAVPGSTRLDAMGCYPIFCCADWQGLRADIDDVGREWISFTMVTDPFGPVGQADLRAIFDHVVPFKEHLVSDLTKPIDQIVSKKRRRHARNALKRLMVEVFTEPMSLVDDWSRLYDCLIRRHRLTGMKALSRTALSRLFAVPGLVALRASFDGAAVGMHLLLVQGDIVYGHLGAYDELGYRMGASHALHFSGIEHFAGKARWIDWGSGAGLVPGNEDGLTSFKEAFSNERRWAYLCGRILDPAGYRDLAGRSGTGDTSYFPAYRSGELA